MKKDNSEFLIPMVSRRRISFPLYGAYVLVLIAFGALAWTVAEPLSAWVALFLGPGTPLGDGVDAPNWAGEVSTGAGAVALVLVTISLLQRDMLEWNRDRALFNLRLREDFGSSAYSPWGGPIRYDELEGRSLQVCLEVSNTGMRPSEIKNYRVIFEPKDSRVFSSNTPKEVTIEQLPGMNFLMAETVSRESEKFGFDSQDLEHTRLDDVVRPGEKRVGFFRLEDVPDLDEGDWEIYVEVYPVRGEGSRINVGEVSMRESIPHGWFQEGISEGRIDINPDYWSLHGTRGLR